MSRNPAEQHSGSFLDAGTASGTSRQVKGRTQCAKTTYATICQWISCATDLKTHQYNFHQRSDLQLRMHNKKRLAAMLCLDSLGEVCASPDLLAAIGDRRREDKRENGKVWVEWRGDGK